jgi:UDP-glucose 4-epimerase
MNETKFEQAIKATALELSSMSSKELRAEVEKRENCDFANIFSETGEASEENLGYYPTQEKLEEIVNQAVAKQLKLFLPIMVEKILSKLEHSKMSGSY